MAEAQIGDFKLHYELTGPEDGPAVVFVNALGTDLRIWDQVVGLMPQGLRILRYDKRGHGRSDCPPGPYNMSALIRDLAALMSLISMRDAVVVGLSIGGMIAQGLAARRLELVRGLVLSNTAAKIGTPDMWEARIEAVKTGGIEAIADANMERWFSAKFRQDPT